MKGGEMIVDGGFMAIMSPECFFKEAPSCEHLAV